MDMDTESTVMITPSEVMEHLFCPRFTYFMNCLNIPQHEEFRYKVMKGRALHERRESENKAYLRKKIDCVAKEAAVYVASPKIRVRGIIDEVLTFKDGSMAPLDYKYMDYRDFLFETHKVQSVLYAMLIKETYQKPVKKGFICYARTGVKLKEIIYQETDFTSAQAIVDEILDVILTGYFPRKTSGSGRCVDCCYKNICV